MVDQVHFSLASQLGGSLLEFVHEVTWLGQALLEEHILLLHVVRRLLLHLHGERVLRFHGRLVLLLTSLHRTSRFMDHDAFEVATINLGRSFRAVSHSIVVSLVSIEVGQEFSFSVAKQLRVILDWALTCLEELRKLFSIESILFVAVLVEVIVQIHFD